MSFERLLYVAAPPDSPLYGGRPEFWEMVESVLEMHLPSDYKSIINRYGTGSFAGYLVLYNPFCPFASSLNLLSGTTKQRLHAYEEGQKEFPQYSPPFPCYPRHGGLFPWGTTENGDTLFWLTEGLPNDWNTVVCDSKFSERYERFPMSTSEFIRAWLCGEVSPSTFAPDLVTCEAQMFTQMKA